LEEEHKTSACIKENSNADVDEFKSAKLPENASKNRYKDILACKKLYTSYSFRK